MANPNMIGGGRMTRSEVSGDRRNLSGQKVNVWALLKRLWKYLGRNRLLVILALVLSCLFAWVPVLNTVSAGLAIVICTVAAAAICAVLFPLPDEEVSA